MRVPTFQVPPPRAGFSLMELIIAISIMSILAGAIAPSMQKQVLKARDARRVTDMQAVSTAIDNYYADRGVWPAANQNSSYGGWDVSHDGNFVSELRNEGYLAADVVDPTNDETYHYRYYVYNKGSYSCQGETKFYVLGIRNFESNGFEAKHAGYFQCDGRDWSSEFAFVTGSGATR